MCHIGRKCKLNLKTKIRDVPTLPILAIKEKLELCSQPDKWIWSSRDLNLNLNLWTLTKTGLVISKSIIYCKKFWNRPSRQFVTTNNYIARQPYVQLKKQVRWVHRWISSSVYMCGIKRKQRYFGTPVFFQIALF